MASGIASGHNCSSAPEISPNSHVSLSFACHSAVSGHSNTVIMKDSLISIVGCRMFVHKFANLRSNSLLAVLMSDLALCSAYTEYQKIEKLL